MVENRVKSSIQYEFELITPEMIENRKVAFLEAISVSNLPEEKLKIGTRHTLKNLQSRYKYKEISVTRLCAEIKGILIILHSDKIGVGDEDINNYFGILSSRKQCFDFFKQCGILGKVKCHSLDTANKVSLGELQDNLDMQERLGKSLSELPQTKQLVLTADKPVSFVELDRCERGLVGILLLEKRPTVIKLTNSAEETEVAMLCGEKGLSPLVYEATQDCIAEEFIDAPRINSFKNNPEMVGQAIGVMLRRLHREGIVYDNRFLDHVCIEFSNQEHSKARTRIIDLEAANFSKDFKVDTKRATRELQEFYAGNKKDFKRAINGFNKLYEGKLQ